MERVARILVKMDNDHVRKWASEEEITTKEVIASLKGEFEDFIYRNRQKLDTDIEFIEWEDFCPRCESTYLKYLRSDEFHKRAYRCEDCECEFTEKELER